jgi:hypothetical protein
MVCGRFYRHASSAMQLSRGSLTPSNRNTSDALADRAKSAYILSSAIAMTLSKTARQGTTPPCPAATT